MTPDIEKLIADLRAHAASRISLVYEKEIATKAADALASLVRERDEARKKAGKLHDYSNMRDAQIVDLQAALTEISSPTQSLNLLWWQIRARKALAALSSERREGP